MRGPFVDPPITALAFRYMEGAPSSALAYMYDVSKSTILNRLHSAGVKLRPRGAPFGNDYARKRQ